MLQAVVGFYELHRHQHFLITVALVTEHMVGRDDIAKEVERGHAQGSDHAVLQRIVGHIRRHQIFIAARVDHGLEDATVGEQGIEHHLLHMRLGVGQLQRVVDGALHDFRLKSLLRG